MPEITAVRGRVVYDSRARQTVEVDVKCGDFMGRVCAPSGASVGKYEAAAFAPEGAAQSAQRITDNAKKLEGIDAGDPVLVRKAIKTIDNTPDYSIIGGAAAFAVTIAAAEAAAKAVGLPLYFSLSKREPRFPFPLGNILGGGAHAGPGTPDIQEILVCPVGANDIRGAINTNITVHRTLRDILEKTDPGFTNGRGDEGGWAPRLDNEGALESAARACEEAGYTLGRDVALGVDFASSTQWDEKSKKYVYSRAGFENDSGEQVDYAARIIEKYKLVYAEDAVHEEAFDDMAELTARFSQVMITGDDLTVTNSKILRRAIKRRACNAAILKVNQAGCLADALEFAREAESSRISLITSHRSGESSDAHISHIGIATGSKMLKAGIVGGERVAKLNELVRLAEHGLICSMAKL